MPFQPWLKNKCIELTTNEHRITSEDRSVITILEEVADAVLSVAWRMQSLDLNAITNGECVAMAGRLRHFGTVLAAYDGHRVGFELRHTGQQGVWQPIKRYVTISTLPPAWS